MSKACLPIAGLVMLCQAVSVSAAVIITTDTLIPLNQSATDALQQPGVTATVTANTITFFGGVSTLHDATSADEPSASTYFDTDGDNGVMVFDLGADGAALRRLDRFDIWLPSNDNYRRNTHIQLAVSMDNSAYTTVADTGTVELPGGTASQFNQLRLDFGAANVWGFRYLQVTGIPVEQPIDSVVRHARWVELDAFTSQVIPEPGSAVLMLLGIAGLLKANRLLHRKHGARP